MGRLHTTEEVAERRLTRRVKLSISTLQGVRTNMGKTGVSALVDVTRLFRVALSCLIYKYREGTRISSLLINLGRGRMRFVQGVMLGTISGVGLLARWGDQVTFLVVRSNFFCGSLRRIKILLLIRGDINCYEEYIISIVLYSNSRGEAIRC